MTTEDTAKHSEFAPSSLDRYFKCPGSYMMCKGIEKHESDAMKEGTLLHAAVANGCFDNLNSEQSEQVQKCLDYIEKAILTDSGKSEVHFEERVDIQDPDSGDPLTFGTADCVIIRENSADIIDWKFGYIEVDEAMYNIQLASYAAGVMQKYGLKSCTAHVYQPRINRQSEYTFTNSYAIAKRIKQIISKCLMGDGVMQLCSI